MEMGRGRQRFYSTLRKVFVVSHISTHPGDMLIEQMCSPLVETSFEDPRNLLLLDLGHGCTEIFGGCILHTFLCLILELDPRGELTFAQK